jgi:hypothetical protein
MTRKDLLSSTALVVVIAFFAVFATSSQPKAMVAGTFAQYLLPAIFTVWLLALIANARTIMELLAAFLLANKERQGSGGRSWGVLVGYALAVVAILLILRSHAILNLIGAVANAVAATAFGTQKAQPQSLQAVASVNPLLWYYTIFIFIGVVLVSFSLFFGAFRTAYTWAREEHSPSRTATERLETMKIVQRAAANLRQARDYRETILNCYRQMCLVLADHGFNTTLQETASEFSQKVSKRLELGGDAVQGLTLLFEQARYSNHEVNDDQRVMALTRLEGLERQLAGADG